jgi:hypothetical protein
MRLPWVYISQKVQALCRVFNMNRYLRRHRRSKVDGMFIQKQIREKDTELCIYCQIDTGVRVGLDISERLYYVTGVGQMCRDCWDETYDNHSRR